MLIMINLLRNQKKKLFRIKGNQLHKVNSNRKLKANQLHKVISNKNVNLSAVRLFLLSVIRPSIEYGNEVWEGNKSLACSLESIILDGAKGSLVVLLRPAIRGV